MVNAAFTIFAIYALVGVMLLTALALMAAPPVSTTAPETAKAPTAQSARGRASVRIVRPYRLRVGREDAASGAQWRSATVIDRAGRRQPARLVEFE